MSNGSSSKSTVLIVLLLISLGFNIYQWSSKTNMKESYETQVDSLHTVQVDVEKELNDTYADLNQYKGINSRLDSLLQEANGRVDEQRTKIQQLISSGGKSSVLNKNLQKELDELKKLRNEYMDRIDNLLVENEMLKKDTSNLRSEVASLSKSLESTVTTASVLKAEYFKITAFKHRSNNKYTETAMAKRTNKIETCFSILENAIAKDGEKTVYVRMMEPGGKVLGNRAEGSSTFKKTGGDEELLFTTSKTVNFNHSKQDVCVHYEEAERVFTAGTYLIEVYVDGNLAGATSLNLK